MELSLTPAQIRLAVLLMALAVIVAVAIIAGTEAHSAAVQLHQHLALAASPDARYHS